MGIWTRKKSHILAWMLVFSGILWSGCEVKRAQVEARTEPTIENGYLGILDELTGLMLSQDADSSKQLERLRVWVSTNHDRVAQTVSQLNQSILDMPPEKRETWRKAARPELEKRLDAYAEAQRTFQKRLNATQKWELGEILSQLQ